MWQQLAFRSIRILSYLSFVTLSLTILIVTGTLALNLFTEIKNGEIIAIVLIAIIAATVFLLNLVIFQLLHYFASNKYRIKYQEIKDYWLETWNDVLWADKEIPLTNDSIAAETLLEMAQNLSYDYRDKFKQIYRASGLLDKDLRMLKYSNLAENRSRALEHLAIVADLSHSSILLKEIKGSIPETSILAFFALAKIYAKTEQTEQEIIDVFVPILESGKFSMGIIEEVLVLLEDNAENLLYYLSRPNMKPKQVKAALAAIGYFANLTWAEWCVPWLSTQDPEITSSALKALAKMRYVPAHAYSEIYEALNNPNWFVRNQAVKASIGVLSDKINDYLVEALADETWWVRYNAATVLAQKGLHGQSLLKQVATNHSDPYARDIALHFLG